jgi:hypothetical protein
VPVDAARRSGVLDALAATLAYTALTIALTWPLARGLARDVPSDLGDPLLNCWILAWDADHLLHAFDGHAGTGGAPWLDRARRTYWSYWHANIYAPHPLALAYSEHLTAQALQILPVYALTKNPVLCHNLLFLSTFALSGLGMYLFARELTSSRIAAFVGGLAYAFAPYRFGSIPHLQVLSSAWMPLTLFGFRRFFDTRRRNPLAGASVAWIAQNLSCSYYLLFFTPVLALYLAWEMTTRRLWTDVRTLARLFAACATVALATLPFVIPYLELRQLGFLPRSLTETDHFSADVYCYLTAAPTLRLWGDLMRAWPKAEGWLFPGLTIAALASTALIATWDGARCRPHQYDIPDGAPSYRRHVERALTWLLAASCAMAVAVLFGWSLRLSFFKITSLNRLFVVVAASAILLLALSARARVSARRFMSSPVGILAALTLFSVAMSFGPHIYSRGKLLENTNVYTLFYNWAPGFDGLRVPARFGMIVALGLAALAAHGVAILGRTRHGGRLAALAAALIVVESIALPFPLNGNSLEYKQHDLAPLPGRIETGAAAPPVYRFITRLPTSATLLELPFGEVAFEARYMLQSTIHWRPLVNGYSGGAPTEYGLLAERLKDIFRRPEPAWQAISSSGATHVIVHEGGYANDRGREVSDWLRAHDARELAAFGTDRVFELPGH